MPNSIRSSSLTIATKVVFDEAKENRYVLMFQWDKSSKQALVITNWPGSIDPLNMDETTHQIIKHIAALGFGGVVMVNLFPKIGITSKGKQFLKEVEQKTNLKQIGELVPKVSLVIVATGSLPFQNSVATDIQMDMLKQIRSAAPDLEVKYLETKQAHPVHPLAPTARREWILADKLN